MDMENQCKKLNVIERPMDTFDTFNETAIDAPTDIITDESENSLVPVNSENSMKKNRKLKTVEKNEFQTGGANLDPAEYTKDVSSDNTELHSITDTSDNPMDTVNKTDRDIEVIDIDIINDKSVNSSVSLNSDNNSMKKKLKLKIVERNEFKAHGTNSDPSKYTKNENLTTAPTSTPNRVLNDNLNINMEKYKYLSKYGCELCDFVAQTKNKYREKQDHLSRVHFKDKIDKLVPKCRPYNCPEIDCSFVGKDNQSVLRHFIGKHDILKKLLKEALSKPNVWMKFLEKIENSSDSIQNGNAGVIIETCPDKTLNTKNIANDGAFENYKNDKDTDIDILEVITEESNVFSQEKKSALLKRIESNVKNNTDIKHEKKKYSLHSGFSAQEDEECIRSKRKCTGINFAQNNIDINDSSSNQLETNLNFKCNFCEAEFAIQSGLKEHIIRDHERKQPIQPLYERPRCLQCHFCSKRFDLQASLDEHIITVHERKQPIQPVYERPKCFHCHFCAKRFDLEASLDEHIISVHK